MTPDYTDNPLVQEALEELQVTEGQRMDATKWIHEAVERYGRHEQSAPRLAALKKQAGEIEKHAGVLTRLLKEVDPYFTRAIAAYVGADDWRRERVAEFLTPNALGDLSARVLHMKRLAKLLHDALPKDTGGGHDLQGELKAPPLFLLAVDCWELFDSFRPGEATAYEDGHYHTFVTKLYGLATQEEPNDTLLKYTKKAAIECNAYATKKPEYRGLRNGSSVMVDVGLAASLYGVPARLLDELTGRKRRR